MPMEESVPNLLVGFIISYKTEFKHVIQGLVNMDNFLKTIFNFVMIIFFIDTFTIWFFSGQSCTDDDECGLTNSVCTSEICDCNTSDGYEDNNGLAAKGFCTKSLGKLHQLV